MRFGEVVMSFMQLKGVVGATMNRKKNSMYVLTTRKNNYKRKDIDMPRFILDVANTKYEGDLDTKAFMEELCEKFGNHFLSVVCVDKTNDNQFHDDAKKNKLSKEQIQNYNNYLEDTKWKQNLYLKQEHHQAIKVMTGKSICQNTHL